MNLKKALMLGVGLVIIGALSYSYVSFHAKPKVSFSNCSTGRPAHSLLAKSSLSSLRALAEYEAVCHGAVTDTLMTFAAMPTTQVEARQSAKLVATTLKQFAAQKITPLVVFEPSSVQPTILAEIKSGIYDTVLEDYYAALKVEGITDAQMGTWVLFPEANTPAWHTTHPNDFAANVRKVASLQKQVFPASKVSILLNSRTYPDDDKAWNHGKLQSLVPYVADLPKGLVDSFGYQGFPSASAADASVAYSQLEAPDFLPARLAIEAAKKMAVKRIWLNTGTFKYMYTGDVAAQISLTTEQRQDILAGVTQQAEVVKKEGFDVSVNLFAADKSKVDEHVDWSYWQPGASSESADTQAFDMFVRGLRERDIGLLLYDQAEEN